MSMLSAGRPVRRFRSSSPLLVTSALLLFPLGTADPAGAAVGLIRLGNEFQVNSYTPGYQARRRSAVTPTATSWWSGAATQDGCRSASSRAASTRPARRAAIEFQVNAYTALRSTARRSRSRTTATSSWRGTATARTAAASRHLRASASTPRGAALGAEFQVNTYTPAPRASPPSACDADGDFVVPGRATGRTATPTASSRRRFDAAGRRRRSSSRSTPTPSRPGLLRSRRWRTTATSWWPGTARVQDGDASASSRGASTRAGANRWARSSRSTPTPPANQRPAALAADADGDFVVAWESARRTAATYGVFARRFTRAGASRPARSSRSTPTPPATSSYPSPSRTTTASFVVAWTYGPGR